MKLIAGLGNPGDIYVHSRHNIGFSVVRALAKNRKVYFKKENSTDSQVTRAKINQQQVILALPMTFMNLSGSAVARLIKKYRIDLEDLLIVCDDLDLEFGRLKLRPYGSCAGHRGLASIIDCLGSQEFSRLRIGIGRPREGILATEYVLSFFLKEEKPEMKKIIDKACSCCESWVINGITKTMNIFNKRSKIDE